MSFTYPHPSLGQNILALDKFDVPQQERSEVVAIVESTRGDIVAE
jgi:hypothetical protein